jgi:hypothetical protein
VPSIGSLHTRSQAPGQRIKAEAPLEAEKMRGKSAESPAHEAKAALAEAALGHSAPNLFGKVTSAIARGIAFEAILALQAEQTQADPAPLDPGTGVLAEPHPPETTPGASTQQAPEAPQIEVPLSSRAPVG